MIYCYICYGGLEDEKMICGICDNYYCFDCSYIFSLHYQFEGSRCYRCADQSRLTKLPPVEIIRERILNLLEI